MNVSEFLLNAKTGLIDARPVRMISNKGGIEEIRKRTAKQLREGGFNTYAMLGSQNAISSEPEKTNKIEIDIEIDKDQIAPAPAPAPEEKEILPSETEKKPIIGGKGGKQSEASKEEMEQRKRDEAKEPSSKPPYELGTKVGDDDLKAYKSYLIERYGRDAGRLKGDEVEKDSRAFTVALKSYRKINKEITSFNLDNARQWKQWANNMVVQFGEKLINEIAKELGKVIPPHLRLALDAIKDLAHEYRPKTPEDFVGTMKAIQNKLFEGKPEWKEKLGEIMGHAFNDWWKKWKNFPGMADNTDIPENVDKSKIPFGNLI